MVWELNSGLLGGQRELLTSESSLQSSSPKDMSFFQAARHPDLAAPCAKGLALSVFLVMVGG